jgi:hypothetical protein
MGRRQGHADELGIAVLPRNLVRLERLCQACGSSSGFDGHAGEWCSRCRTDRHLENREQLYRLVEIDLDPV